MKFLLVAFAALTLVKDVRDAIARNDFKAAEKIVASQAQNAEALEAHSWLGRGALAAKRYDDAERYANETHTRALKLLKGRKLDADKNLPIALGAAIEVRAHVLAARNERDQAVVYLHEELKRYYDTSIRTRIQKNIHLLSLEGKPAPALAVKGKPTLLFLWAHWCGDCKQQGPIIERIRKQHPKLAVVGPTQYYGYVEAGTDAPPDKERPYIESVFAKHYSGLKDVPTPIDNENFKLYGASTTPTLVLIDRAGIVRLYNPGKMTYEALAEKIGPLVK